MRDEERQFVDQVADLLVPWGMTRTTARLYAYLLLKNEATSLDRIVQDLQLSKSTASVAARTLVTHKLARRQSVPGSKRILYGATANYAVLFAEQSTLLQEMTGLMQGAAADLTHDLASARLLAMAHFLSHMQQAIDKGLRDVSADPQ